MHSFKASLAKGQAGEEAFHNLFPELTRTDGRLCDFITPAGHRLELKKESRTTAETPNIAVEIESSPGRLGAIYTASHNKVKYFVYFFADSRYFVYDTEALLEFILTNADRFRLVKVRNSTYYSTVILLPRLEVQSLEVGFE